jgi:hypothetical protein
MASWVKCTTTKGELIFVNLDNAVTMAHSGACGRKLPSASLG